MAEILINTNDRRIQYVATNGQTVFPYDFPIYVNTHITVMRIRAGVVTTRVLTTDYTVSGVGAEAGGNVTLTAGATTGDIMTLFSSTPYERTSDYGQGGDFKAATVNKDFDYQTMLAQQNDRNIGRALTLHIADSSTPLQFDIATTVSRQSMVLTTDATGTKVQAIRSLASFDTNVSDTATNAAAAAASASAAATSASNAATSATNASNSASSASTSATNAANSATAASGSATAAAGSATSASGSATSASTSASNASTSASSAATSATTATTQATNAANSASAAATSATNASTSATNASNSASAAATSETNAAASAAKLKGTSTTSLAIGTGTKSFTTQTGKQFNVGQFMQIVSDANPATNWMFGQITAYNTGTGALDVNVLVVGGAGTLADWSLYVAGARGAVGATGPTGSVPIAAAGGTADAITADFTPDLTLTDKVVCMVVAGAANATTTPTYAPDGLTARTIVKNGGQALVAGDIRAAGHVLILEYNLANTRWELLNPVFTQTSVTGNAGTATALQTPRNINGTAFDGTANITVTAAAGSLTGTTLNATVVSSSLTSVGTLTGGATGAGFTIALTTSTVTGTLGISNGGTGQTTAAAAFGALKQNATTGATGVVQIATNAETLTGTDTAKVLTPDDLLYAFSNNMATEPRRRSTFFTDLFHIVDCLTSVAGTGGSVNVTTSASSRPGRYDLQRGTTTTGRAALYHGGGSTATWSGNTHTVAVGMTSGGTVSDGTNTFVTRYGFMDSFVGEPTNGVYYRYTHSVNSGNFQCVCRASGVETVINTSQPGHDASTLDLRAVGSTTSVQFFINGVSQGTISTNVPVAGVGFGAVGASLIGSAGTANRLTALDYFFHNIEMAGGRG